MEDLKGLRRRAIAGFYVDSRARRSRRHSETVIGIALRTNLTAPSVDQSWAGVWLHTATSISVPGA